MLNKNLYNIDPKLLISLCVVDTIFLISNVLTAREAFGYKGKELLLLYIRTYINTYTHTYIHTYIHTYVHTYILSLTPLNLV